MMMLFFVNKKTIVFNSISFRYVNISINNINSVRLFIMLLSNKQIITILFIKMQILKNYRQ